jgi:hypothetical protein
VVIDLARARSERYRAIAPRLRTATNGAINRKMLAMITAPLQYLMRLRSSGTAARLATPRIAVSERGNFFNPAAGAAEEAEKVLKTIAVFVMRGVPPPRMSGFFASPTSTEGSSRWQKLANRLTLNIAGTAR